MGSSFQRIFLGRGAAILAVSLLFILEGCSRGVAGPTPLPEATRLTLTPSPTPFVPSPTPEPNALLVNGQAITLADFQAELGRYQAAVGTQLATPEPQKVIDSLVDELLLAQGAAAEGYVVDAGLLQERYDQLVSQLGGAQPLLDWMATNGYTEAGFRASLERALAAAWMRDRITGGIPEQGEQVHARQILLYNSDEAAAILARLSAGEDFDALAVEYDPVGAGDLGWFPAGFLLDPGLDQAVFALTPGQTSQVIQTAAGYHIIKVLERETQRTLDPAARLVLQQKRLQNWLQNQRSQSQIQILLP